jgi:UDP-glucuronate 4-epimerase
MSVLVTGAGGFVGLNLVERLLTEGEEVVTFSANVIDPGLCARFQALPGQLTNITGDVREAGHLNEVLRRFDVKAVVHLATITASAERERRDAATVVAVNLGGLVNALTAAAQAGVRRFVYPSSIAVFGPDTPDGGLIEEGAAHDPRTLYAITKSAGEAMVARLGELYGLDWVVGRIGRVFGPYEHDTGVRDTMSQIYQVMQRARDGEPVSFARPCVKNWNYAPDTAADLARLVQAPGLAHRVYNLGARYAWSLQDWCERLANENADFRYRIGGDEPGQIDLLGSHDGALLSWGRFEADFERPTPHDLDSAFHHYLRFLDPAFEKVAP